LKTSLSFFTPVQAEIQAVEVLMRSQTNNFHSDLTSALDLILKSGGKRIRPNLTLLAGRMLGAQKDRLITLAAAIEMLHTATLVHDDLIDGSLLRRGMPTLNAHWSPGATILTGDFLFACAAHLASETNSIPVMSLFSRTLQVIVNGEIAQMFTGHCVVNRENYDQRIYAKTASLFETSACSAALISDAGAEIAEYMRQYGYDVGMAFQIIDDILDFTGEQATVGKPVGSDLRNGLVTLPAIYYIEEHPKNPDAVPFLEGNCPEPDQIENLIQSIRSSNAISRAHADAVSYVKHGLAQISRIPQSAESQSLIDLAEFIIAREI